MKHVQIIDNDCIHDYAKEKYPTLYAEVREHDGRSSSSWYDLSEEAFKEYEVYHQELKSRGIFRENAKINCL